jgi:hypothetical protein
MSKLEQLMKEIREGVGLEEVTWATVFKGRAMYVADHILRDKWWKNTELEMWKRVEAEYKTPEHLFPQSKLNQIREKFKNELAAVVLRHFERLLGKA